VMSPARARSGGSWPRRSRRWAGRGVPGGSAAGLLAAGAVAGGGGLMEEGMIQTLVMAARLACARMIAGQLGVLRDSVERGGRVRVGAEGGGARGDFRA
jgi:hypothetical protein